MKPLVKMIAPVLLGCVLTLGSCGKKEKELSPKEIEAKADSIVARKVGQMEQQAREDLDKRLPIEIKPKVDSIRKIRPDSIPSLPVLQEEADSSDTPPAPLKTTK
ncbi:hypothetical protein [Taibaiella chishuiensis]|uniref:Lipoprotein n=1 Tax=Taibaiella chishuiensis TaxID=1434707 RepID=A0A2P8DD77_9BACT|nr:hypothetical protein [Taibaiella chishuiensis]PSK95183.1 hypothetical protein B0I18_1011349 [Taibaiella chishuiensis]